MGAGLKAPDGTPVNERIGSYILRRYLTQGGMAALFLAHRVESREVVVAKRVLPQFSRDKSFTRMFSREAQLASLLRHPNIVQVYDAGGLETEGCYFIMEYIHGVDLSHFLGLLRDRNMTMPLDHALTIALGMCNGLNHAHDMRGADGQPLEIVHRDVSPSNVMISYGGNIKVMDFGVAKALALTSFTEAGTRKGKLSYMPPEQARADELDRRADVFAIGAVLFELTTMRRLFTGSNELAVIHQLLYEERKRPSSLVPGYPPALEAIVMRAVEHKAEDRFQSAAELGDAIRAFAIQAGLRLSEDALGAFLREQISPPPHPAEEPDFFEDDYDEAAMPDAATAIEPVGPHDTSIEALSDGGGLVTNGGYSQPRGAAAYPTTTAPYQATPNPPVIPMGPARVSGGGLSGTARAAIAAAAVLTLAASGAVAFLLTQGDDPPPSSPAQSSKVDSPPVAAPADTPAAPSDPASNIGAPPTEPTPTEPTPTEPEADDSATVVEEVIVDDGGEPAVEATDAPPGPTPTATKKKKKKKKAAAPPDPTPEPTPAETTKKKKKKRNPTDTLLPIGP